MIATAVVPMAVPMSTFRSMKFQLESGELGLNSSTPNTHAETMNVPRHHASIRYSGQCCLSALIIVDDKNHRPCSIYSVCLLFRRVKSVVTIQKLIAGPSHHDKHKCK